MSIQTFKKSFPPLTSIKKSGFFHSNSHCMKAWVTFTLDGGIACDSVSNELGQF